jgi:prevent-host-death family protein
MRTVNIGELKNQLSAYLQYVRNGEEVIVRDRNTPVARILPIHADSLSEHEAKLVASGAMTLPLEEMDWDAFFAEDIGENVSPEVAAAAVEESRGQW